MSTSAQHFADPGAVQERRVHPRILPKSLIYVACGESNGGMVLNASDDGLAISMAIAVGDDSFSQLHVRMNGLPQSIEVHGRMVWTTGSKKRAGIHLLDVTDNQREQIREWIAMEGLRDVNLLPRVADGVSVIAPVATAAAVSPAVFAEPRSSLLDGFGGTAPETLGPVTHEEQSAFGPVHEAEPSHGFDTLSDGGFRENEWDLAAVAMIPRKKSRPAGLSAIGLVLLWIAIPSFGIGILVGRRPLEQWLSSAGAVGKDISKSVTSGSDEINRQNSAPMVKNADATPELQLSQPSSSPDLDIEAPSATDKYGAASAPTSNFVNSGNAPAVDAKLLNSISTQEAHALKAPKVITVAKPVDTIVAPDLDSKMKVGPITKPGLAAATNVKTLPGIGTDSTAPRSNPVDSTGAKISEVHGKNSAPAGGSVAANVESRSNQAASFQNSRDRLPRTISVDSGFNSDQAKKVADVATQRPTASGAPASVVTSNTSEQNFATVHGNHATEPSKVSVTSSPTTGNPSAATSSAGHTEIASKESKPTPSGSTSISSAAPAPAVSPAPARAFVPSIAPVAAQPPLRGTMLVARKNDQTFLLRLPVEAVPGGQSTAIRMQRFVMVPAQSRWHRHGPIAKLKIGELLAHDAPASGAKFYDGDVITVRAFIDKDGVVQDLKPVSGRFALMPRVMRSVREWQFDQTLIDGKAVDSEVNITVEFRAKQ